MLRALDMTGLLVLGQDLSVGGKTINDQDRDGLNVALNEATWIGIKVDVAARRVALLMDVLSLPVEGPAAPETPVVITLDGVSRIAASLRNGWWNDAEAEVVPLTLDDLDSAVRSFGGCPVYGWEFVDPPEESWAHWRGRLSLDVAMADEASPHMLDVFQAGGSAAPRHLDLRVWFRHLSVSTPVGDSISLADFVDSGVRWWDGLYAGDPRTGGSGIFPLRPD